MNHISIPYIADIGSILLGISQQHVKRCVERGIVVAVATSVQVKLQPHLVDAFFRRHLNGLHTELGVVGMGVMSHLQVVDSRILFRVITIIETEIFQVCSPTTSFIVMYQHNATANIHDKQFLSIGNVVCHYNFCSFISSLKVWRR